MAKETRITFARPKTGDAMPKGTRVTFGAVTVTSAKPQAEVVARNVAVGQSALKRAAGKISRPGITLRAGKGIPLYYVDDARPKEIVQELDGKKVFGSFRNGKFVASNG